MYQPAHHRFEVGDPAALLAELVAVVPEAERPDPWSIDDASDGYVETQVKAIVGLELRITRLEAKRKLTQNRSSADFEGTMAGLAAGPPGQVALADEMRRETPPNTRR